VAVFSGGLAAEGAAEAVLDDELAALLTDAFETAGTLAAVELVVLAAAARSEVAFTRSRAAAWRAAALMSTLALDAS